MRRRRLAILQHHRSRIDRKAVIFAIGLLTNPEPLNNALAPPGIPKINKPKAWLWKYHAVLPHISHTPWARRLSRTAHQQASLLRTSPESGFQEPGRYSHGICITCTNSTLFSGRAKRFRERRPRPTTSYGAAPQKTLLPAEAFASWPGLATSRQGGARPDQ